MNKKERLAKKAAKRIFRDSKKRFGPGYGHITLYHGTFGWYPSIFWTTEEQGTFWPGHSAYDGLYRYDRFGRRRSRRWEEP